MFLNFLKAEWRTIFFSFLFVFILVGGFYFSSGDVMEVEESGSYRGSCLIPGERLGLIVLGMRAWEVEDILGVSDSKESSPLGVVWRYGVSDEGDLGNMVITFRDEGVVSVMLLGSVSGYDACFSDAVEYARRDKGSIFSLQGEEWYQYSSGWMCYHRADSGQEGYSGVGVYLRGSGAITR